MSSSAPFRVLVAVPALEALLFVRPDPIARAYGAAAVDEQLLELGRMNPREALKRLDPTGQWWVASLNLVRNLDDGDIAELRSMPPIQDLLDFLGSLSRNEIVATIES